MKNKSIKKNYIYNLIYQILLVIIPIIVTPYISRVLLAEGIGRYSFSFSLISYFTIFAIFGFDNYGQREIAKNQENKELQTKTFWEITICKLITVGVSLLIHCVLLATNVYGNYSLFMQILTINIVAIAFDLSFYFQGNEDFGKLISKNILIKVVGTILIFIFVKNPGDVWKYTLINSLIVLISNLFLWPSLLCNLKKVKINSLKPLKHLPQALKLFIPALAISLYTVLDKTFIGFITKSDIQNGFYEQTEKIVKLALTVITCLGTVMIPRNSHEIAHGNHEKVKTNIYKAFNFVWLIGLPLMVGIILVSKNLIPWFLGTNFTSSYKLLICFSPLIIIIGASNVLGLQYMIPYKREKQYTTALLFGALANIGLNFVLIYFYQALGATIATITAEFCVTIAMFIFTRKELSFKQIIKTIVKPLIASVLMFLIVLPLSIYLTSSVLNTMIIVGVGFIVYAIAILLLKEQLLISFLKNVINKIKEKLHR